MPLNYRHFLRDSVTLTAVAVVYFLLAKAGLEFASIHPSATPIWPPTGFAIAAVLLFGYRVAPAVFAGAVLANVTTAGTMATSIAIGLGNTAECLLAGYLVKTWSGGSATFETPSRVGFFVFASLFPTAISATIGATTLAATGFADDSEILQLWLTWWMGDLAGALVICPALVLWWVHRERHASSAELLETFAIYVIACAVGLVAFSPLFEQTAIRNPLAFLAILPLLWAALRRTQRETASVAVIICGFAIWGTLLNSGPFARPTINESFLMLLAFMTSVAVPSLALSAAVAVRNAVERDLRIAHDLQGAHLRVEQKLARLGNWMWDTRKNKITWSPGLHEIYGLREGDFAGTFEAFLARVHPEDRDRVRRSVMRALEDGTSFSLDERIIHSDGTTRHLATAGEVIKDEDGYPLYMIGACQDVSKQKKTETALQTSELQYQLMVDSVHDYALYMLDPDGRVVTWNSAAARIKGYSASEIIGQNFSRFFLEEEQTRSEPQRELQVAASEGRFEAEVRRVRKNGEWFWAHIVVDPIRDTDGNLIGFAKITRDITERKETQAALERTREQLAQAQKMEAIGQLTGGIAHDFNNLLMIISGYTQILQRGLSEPRQLKAIDAIRAAAERGAGLTRQLLSFSRRQALHPVVVDLPTRLGTIKEMLARTLPGNIVVELDIPSDIWHVQVDIGEFELALVNIAVNARDAMPKGGTIFISAGNRVLDIRDIAPLQGEFVALSVRDNGTGIPRDILARVFEPFFTTKATGKGTGLGLSQVYGFAHQSGGTAVIESEQGRGTSVTIFLPRSHGVPTQLPGDSVHEDTKRLAGVALLVEDNTEVAAVTMSLLEQAGCEVVHTDSAADALERLKADNFDFVLSDIVMPGGMDGIQLAHKIRAQYPLIPILLISGYSDAAVSAVTGFILLKKPFDAAELDRAVREAMAQHNAASSAQSASAAG
jgi:PAS domain S-box-containing protein